MKQRVTIPFGKGLDRGTGVFLVAPDSFADLRNVHLKNGRIRVRRGITPNGGGIAGATDVLAVSPIRGTQRSVAVAYSRITRQAWVVTAVIDPTTQAVTLTPVPSGTLWTLSQNAAFPRVVVVDSFGKAFVAHDEPSVQFRQPVKVFDQSDNTISNLLLQGGSVPMTMRGVARHLQYVVGWGYGFDTIGPPDQRNRPETLRFSIPGDPTAFDANWYMLIGQRGEPIVSAGAIPPGLIVAKENELHLVVGTNPATFDSQLIDPYFGAVSGNAGIVVGDTYYFWSNEGPRASQGAESVPLGHTALDLIGGTVPDAIIEETDYRSCFALFRPEEREVEWLFPVPGRNLTWSYAVHLDATPMQWSYRPYTGVIRCAGQLQGNIAFDANDPINIPYPSPSSVVSQSDSWFRHTVSWSNNNIASLPAGSVVELWASHGVAVNALTAPWTLVGSTPASGVSQTATIRVGGPNASRTLPERVLNHDAVVVALRYRYPDGSYAAAWSSGNPTDWPSTSRGTNLRLNSAAPGFDPRGTEFTLTFDVMGGAPVTETTPVTAKATLVNPAVFGPGSFLEVWGFGDDSAPSVGAARGSLNASLLSSMPISAGQTVYQATGLVVARRWKGVMFRVRFGEYTGTAAYVDAQDWTSLATSKFLPWGAPDYRPRALDISKPFPLVISQQAGGGTPARPTRPILVNLAIPQNTEAPDGDWALEAWGISTMSNGFVQQGGQTFEVRVYSPEPWPTYTPGVTPAAFEWIAAGQLAVSPDPALQGQGAPVMLSPVWSPKPPSTYTLTVPLFTGYAAICFRLLYNGVPYDPVRYSDTTPNPYFAGPADPLPWPAESVIWINDTVNWP